MTVQPMIQLEGSELIIASSPDPQLGPVLLFGAGGHWSSCSRTTLWACRR